MIRGVCIMTDTNKNRLWEEYIKTKSEKLREQIIIEYVPLVKLVAGRLNMYLGYTVEYDDLVSYGAVSLYTSPSPRDGLLSRMPSSA